MKENKFSFTNRWKSFGYAYNGLRNLWKYEHNARIHSLAALVAICLGFVYKISSIEWLAVVLSIGFVFTTEIINTSIENMADFISLEKHPQIKIIKGLAAAAVLISAITSIVIALIIFLPKL